MADLLDPTPLIAQITAAISIDPDLDHVTVTDDPTHVGPLAGNGVVYVNAPTLSFENYDDEIDATWTLDIVQGTAHNLNDARTRIGKIIASLHAGAVNIARADPATWRTAQGNDLPAYTLTLNPL